MSETPVLFRWAHRPQYPVRRRKIAVHWARSSLQVGSRCAWYPLWCPLQSAGWVKVCLVSTVVPAPVCRLGQGVPGIHCGARSSLQVGSRCAWYPLWCPLQSAGWVKVCLVSTVVYASNVGSPGIEAWLRHIRLQHGTGAGIAQSVVCWARCPA